MNNDAPFDFWPPRQTDRHAAQIDRNEKPQMHNMRVRERKRASFGIIACNRIVCTCYAAIAIVHAPHFAFAIVRMKLTFEAPKIYVMRCTHTHTMLMMVIYPLLLALLIKFHANITMKRKLYDFRLQIFLLNFDAMKNKYSIIILIIIYME